MSGPIKFTPIYQTRVWGGRSLETVYQRALPDEQPYGESWEISARSEADSVVENGEFSGKTLTDLWRDHRETIFGSDAPDGERFPLLCKILDAQDRLSIQVHPPDRVAASLIGEPKTEMWYIAHAEPGAELYVGVAEGVTSASFEAALHAGTLEDQVHRMPVSTGDHIFIPSGRLHAIGAGLVIYEIQQNSDTTYRVYDWGRVGLDGQPRDLHIEESLKCIDFSDVAPSLDEPDGSVIASCEHFVVEQFAAPVAIPEGRFAIVTVVDGPVECGGETFVAGDFFIIPADGTHREITGGPGAAVLTTRFPAI